MDDHLRVIPEIIEHTPGQMLDARRTFLSQKRSSLGLADLCTISRVALSVVQTPSAISSYHFVSGVDASSSAAIAAYVSNLFAFLPPSVDVGLFGRGGTRGWRIRRAVYCCYDLFAGHDVHVEVNMPGGVSATIAGTPSKELDSPRAWQQLHLSVFVRHMMLSFNSTPEVNVGLRRMQMFPDLASESALLECAAALCSHWWRLGTDVEVPLPTLELSKTLPAVALNNYFHATRRHTRAIAFFSQLSKTHKGLDSLVAEHLLAGGQMVAAMRVLHCALVPAERPDFSAALGASTAPFLPSWPCLLTQCRLLLDRGRDEDAVAIARIAVDRAPWEPEPWLILCEALIQADDPRGALIALNGCPAAGRHPRGIVEPLAPLPAVARMANLGSDASDVLSDAERIAMAAVESNNGGISPTTSADSADMEDERRVDMRLFGNMRAGRLLGTAARAYALLTMLARRFGWDALLAHRSAVFWMEEAYQRTATQVLAKPVAPSKPTEQPRATEQPAATHDDESRDANRDGSDSTVETTESDGPTDAAPPNTPHPDEVAGRPVVPPKPRNSAALIATTRRRPTKAILLLRRRKTTLSDDSDDDEYDDHHGNANKIMSERWLDELFRLLYDDLCAFALVFPPAPSLALRATGSVLLPPVLPTLSRRELILAGDLATRLGRANHARAAYEKVLSRDLVTCRPVGVSMRCVGRVALLASETASGWAAALAALAVAAAVAEADPRAEVFTMEVGMAAMTLAAQMGGPEAVLMAVHEDPTLTVDQKTKLKKVLSAKIFAGADRSDAVDVDLAQAKDGEISVE